MNRIVGRLSDLNAGDTRSDPAGQAGSGSVNRINSSSSGTNELTDQKTMSVKEQMASGQLALIMVEKWVSSFRDKTTDRKNVKKEVWAVPCQFFELGWIHSIDCVDPVPHVESSGRYISFQYLWLYDSIGLQCPCPRCEVLG
mmetsp:Transcript_45946/g.112109  ORF Transcript_45946/g.112109 Transcript_45946/m.112109 type:complete len:142 (-) Transcript_45946:960-1385(-)